MQNMSELTYKIKQMACDLGFDKVGVAPAHQPKKSKFLDSWLKNNHHGSMEWMAKHKEKRKNIRNLFPDAQSVISVAYNYYTGFEHSANSQFGKISRYAWGEDYHRIMKKKLKHLLQKIRELDQKITGRVCVDTAPIMDKLWAEQAGLGWQGKHTNLITRDFGSWVFLGELIVDSVLEYDKPIEDFCGNCQACIKACPTGAIIEPYQLDANKCISYLTIEYWDKPIPENLKNKLSGWIFGCDICQDVCPWNKNHQVTSEERFLPKEGNVAPMLSKWSLMEEISFKARFKKSAVKRTGHSNFIRNIKSNDNKST